ncbi:response regulator transcription factor [Cryobacterium adonitolivorans]|uniref:Response regulator transcription factor n=1 Tax=Cryobacterium adonitolivorans TaxID=1259189 RepID=A0A4R8W4M9_9MICO|nr:response regulator transcription factor [Cryobacterium adonitolivorans]TFB99567.1 response regulator transcription factor [Cryobacterium adonitolivorans]
MRILIADDDPQILRALRITLGARGYEIVTAHDGVTALAAIVEYHPDLLMLDLGMPALDGLAVIDSVRAWNSVPILVVSGRSGASDKVEALDRGADDYVTKPFSIDELLARIRALTRRMPTSGDEPVVTFGNITVDLPAKTIVRAAAGGAEHVRLTPTEWQILELLLRTPGKLVTRQALYAEVWGQHKMTDTGYLRLYLAQLRKKLETDPSRPRYLITEAGMGYRFAPDPPAGA